MITFLYVMVIVKVNVVGPFVLTRLLEPMLKKGKDPRVINVASVMHRFNEMPPPDTFMRWGYE